MEKKYISKATLSRLPLYYTYLKNLGINNDSYISATKVARDLHMGEVKVRKDLGCISELGKPKLGYRIFDLIVDIEKLLMIDNNEKCIVVGCGNLGKALLYYDGFSLFGINVVAGFDKDVKKIDSTSEKKIYSVTKLKKYITDNKIKLAIITVPRDKAQEICDMLVLYGIKGIFNFAQTTLVVPNDVYVEQENLALSLASLYNRVVYRNNN